MTTFVVFVVVALLAAWMIHRRSRRTELAGRDAEKPTYNVTPPSRSVGSRKTERL